MARPREFDAEVALERAMDLLWSKGYEATSLDDLCEATGLSRSSFYAAFGSKRQLLVSAVDRYTERRVSNLADILLRPVPVREAFGDLLDSFIERIAEGSGRRGCFSAIVRPNCRAATVGRWRKSARGCGAPRRFSAKRWPGRRRGGSCSRTPTSMRLPVFSPPEFRGCDWSARSIRIAQRSRTSRRPCCAVSIGRTARNRTAAHRG